MSFADRRKFFERLRRDKKLQKTKSFDFCRAEKTLRAEDSETIIGSTENCNRDSADPDQEIYSTLLETGSLPKTVTKNIAEPERLGFSMLLSGN